MPPRLTGALAIRRVGSRLFLGHMDNAMATAACFRDELFLTDDMVQIKLHGAITLLGRVNDIMNAGGFRVALSKIENQL